MNSYTFVVLNILLVEVSSVVVLYLCGPGGQCLPCTRSDCASLGLAFRDLGICNRYCAKVTEPASLPPPTTTETITDTTTEETTTIATTTTATSSLNLQEEVDKFLLNPGVDPPKFHQAEGINGDGKDSSGNDLSGDRAGNFTGPSVKWPTRIDGRVKVPYRFEGGIDSKTRKAVEEAIQDFKNHTCIDFIPRSCEPHYVEIISDDDGKEAGQKLSLGKGCEYKGHAIHELMHTLGVGHEHKRTDRDQHVAIHPENIVSGKEHNFIKCANCTKCMKYDIRSVMHYEKEDFSKNGQSTITAKDPKIKLVGQRRGFSKEDIKKINKFYSCGSTKEIPNECDGQAMDEGIENTRTTSVTGVNTGR